MFDYSGTEFLPAYVVPPDVRDAAGRTRVSVFLVPIRDDNVLQLGVTLAWSHQTGSDEFGRQQHGVLTFFDTRIHWESEGDIGEQSAVAKTCEPGREWAFVYDVRKSPALVSLAASEPVFIEHVGSFEPKGLRHYCVPSDDHWVHALASGTPSLEWVSDDYSDWFEKWRDRLADANRWVDFRDKGGEVYDAEQRGGQHD